jgi:hypothetical protein
MPTKVSPQTILQTSEQTNLNLCQQPNQTTCDILSFYPQQLAVETVIMARQSAKNPDDT